MNKIARNIMIILLLIWIVFPLVPLFITAFARVWQFPDLWPDEWSLRAWDYIIQSEGRIGIALFNSMAIAVSVTMLCMLIGIPAGYALSNSAFIKRPIFEFMILAPLIVPGLSVVMGIHVVFIYFGLADTMFGVIIAHLIPALPYMIIVMRGIFANHDANYELQSRSLGANYLQTIYYVTIPSVCPGIITGSLFVFLISWGQYILTLFVGGGRIITLPILLFSFASSGDRSIAAALSLIFILPVIIIMIVSSRYLTGQYAAMGDINRI